MNKLVEIRYKFIYSVRVSTSPFYRRYKSRRSREEEGERDLPSSVRMSYLLPHLHSGWAVDQAILAEEERLVVIRFGHDWDETCMQVPLPLFDSPDVYFSAARRICSVNFIYLLTAFLNFEIFELFPIRVRNPRQEYRCSIYRGYFLSSNCAFLHQVTYFLHWRRQGFQTMSVYIWYFLNFTSICHFFIVIGKPKFRSFSFCQIRKDC